MSVNDNRKRWVASCGLVVFALLWLVTRAAAAPQADTVIIAASDAMIADKQPSQRFGGSTFLRVGYDPTLGYLRTLLRYELSDGLPSNAYVEQAYVELYVSSASPPFDPPLSTDLYRVDEAWSETLVSWNNQPTLGDQISNTAVNRDPNFYQWDVTQLVRDWDSGARANHGVMLIADASPLSVRSRTFYAREIGGGLFPPRLVIRYSTDSTPPTATVSALPAYSPKQFTVSWSGSDSGGSGLAYYDVQYRLNSGTWTAWQSKTTATSAVFTAQTAGYYEFRARAADKAGNVQPFGNAQAATLAGVGSATMVPFGTAVTNNPVINLSWNTDSHGGAAVTSYTVYLSFNNGGFAPIPSLTNVAVTSASYTAALGDGLYAFQVTARNAEGAQEPLQTAAEAAIIVDAQPPFIEPRLWLPITAKS